ncbi:MAG TPA: YlxR family protein, partial [Thermoanaerobacterales bacterium]|nr:YlxR family protein [Thermoanaerobacterales bacterium]
RGAYICPTIGCLEKALKNRGLEKSLKQAVDRKLFSDLFENSPVYCLF